MKDSAQQQQHLRATYELGIGLKEIIEEHEREEKSAQEAQAMRNYRHAVEQVRSSQEAHAGVMQALGDSNARCAGLDDQKSALEVRLAASEQSLVTVTQYTETLQSQLEAANSAKQNAVAMLQTSGEHVSARMK